MNIRKARGLISTILIASALLSFSTGAVLFFLKYGMWMGMTRKFLHDVHVVSGLVMGIAVVIHLILNRKLYKMEMRELLHLRAEKVAREREAERKSD